MNEKIYDWRELDLQSMDLVLCAGNSKMSRAIVKFQDYAGAPIDKAQISHVAGIDRFFADESYWLQESTTLNPWANKEGVQRNALDIWLNNYDGKVYVRKMDFDRNIDFYGADERFWDKHKDDSYESGIPGNVELILCGLRLHRAVKKFFPNYVPKFTDNPHCTELQALRMIVHSLWVAEPIINRLPPWLWVSKIDERLNVNIGKPIRIK